MAQTREAMAQNLAERWCGQVARRDDARVARRLYRKPVVEGVYRLDEGALLDDFCHCLHELWVVDWLNEVQGTAVQRVMVPCVQYVWLYGLKTLYGVERMHALPTVLFSAEARMRWVGCNAHLVGHWVCQWGAARRQGPHTEEPIGQDTLAEYSAKWNRRELEALLNGVMWALAKMEVLAATVTGIVASTDLETTAPYEGGGHVPRRRKITDTHGQGHAIEVAVDGEKLIVLMDAATKMPVAGTVVPIQEHEVPSMRALVTQARTYLAGHARLHQVVFDPGLLDGTDRWWLDQHDRLVVIPAKNHMAVTVDAHAAAGAGVTAGRIRGSMGTAQPRRPSGWKPRLWGLLG